MAQLTEEVEKSLVLLHVVMANKVKKKVIKIKILGKSLLMYSLYLLCLANQTGTDLQAAFDQKLDLKQSEITTAIIKIKIKIVLILCD